MPNSKNAAPHCPQLWSVSRRENYSIVTYAKWVGCNTVAADQLEELAIVEGAVVVVVPLREQVLEGLGHEAALLIVGARVRAVLLFRQPPLSASW